MFLPIDYVDASTNTKIPFSLKEFRELADCLDTWWIALFQWWKNDYLDEYLIFSHTLYKIETLERTYSKEMWISIQQVENIWRQFNPNL